MSCTPAFLVLEMRLTFASCARTYHRNYPGSRTFSHTARSLKGPPSKPPSNTRSPKWPYNGALTSPRNASVNQSHRNGSEPPPDSTELVPQKPQETALDTGRRVPVPMRAIPKAQGGSNLKLSPRERLHIEVLTRHQPAPTEKQIYRERLQIYHIGAGKERGIIFGKMLCITAACFSTFIMAPASLAAGSSIPMVALVWLAGLVPIAGIHYWYTPMASRVFLRLPTKARETSKAAMEYAKNLPRDVDLEIEYLQPLALPKQIKVRVSELEPVESKSLLQRLTFKWRDQYKSRRPRFSPSGFYLQPESALGESSKNTIPGLWEGVYHRLITPSNDKAASRWNRPTSRLNTR